MPNRKTEINLSRRQMWQMHQHIEKTLAWVIANRDQQRTDTIGIFLNLDEMVALLFGARVRLERVCNKMYGCKPAELEAYK